MTSKRSTPGARRHQSAPPPRTIELPPTALPVFIGYTARAEAAGRSLTGVPTLISSWQEFQECFGAPATPVFFARPTAAGDSAPDLVLAGRGYDVRPDPGTVYHLARSVQLFYLNGGNQCVVVSVGPSGPLRQNAGAPKTAPLINPNVRLADLGGGLAAARSVTFATLLAIPDAVLLSAADYASLAPQMLVQCGELRSCFALLDVPGGAAPDPQDFLTKVIAPFRAAVGQQSLGYGAAYFPFLRSTLLAPTDLDHRNVGGGAAALAALLPDAKTAPLKKLLAQLASAAPGTPSPRELDAALRTASSAYAQLQAVMLAQANVLPPSGAIAGVYATVDAGSGVWRAPANISLNAVTAPTLSVTTDQQEPLNVDMFSGKSINAVRQFDDQCLIWGARTLDGNSEDWRYINARRTTQMLEQAINLQLQSWRFSPNTADTWKSAKESITQLFTALWQAGALAGASPAEAFTVECGLGESMDPNDVLDGTLRLTVKVALLRGGQFIAITCAQTQAS